MPCSDCKVANVRPAPDWRMEAAARFICAPQRGCDVTKRILLRQWNDQAKAQGRKAAVCV